MGRTDQIKVGDRIRYGFSVMDWAGIVTYVVRDAGGNVTCVCAKGVELACDFKQQTEQYIPNISGITVIEDDSIWYNLIKNEPSFKGDNNEQH